MSAVKPPPGEAGRECARSRLARDAPRTEIEKRDKFRQLDQILCLALLLWRQSLADILLVEQVVEPRVEGIRELLPVQVGWNLCSFHHSGYLATKTIHIHSAEYSSVSGSTTTFRRGLAVLVGSACLIDHAGAEQWLTSLLEVLEADYPRGEDGAPFGCRLT